MPRAKKTFDREDMYKRIMPTASRSEQQEVVREFGDNTEKEILEINSFNSSAFSRENTESSAALFQNKAIKWIADSETETILYNITERLVIHRLDIALTKMKCCRCDRCKLDILSIALNSLKPHYVVCSSAELEDRIKNDEAFGLEVTSAILKAILLIRKNPRH